MCISRRKKRKEKKKRRENTNEKKACVLHHTILPRACPYHFICSHHLRAVSTPCCSSLQGCMFLFTDCGEIRFLPPMGQACTCTAATSGPMPGRTAFTTSTLLIAGLPRQSFCRGTAGVRCRVNAATRHANLQVVLGTLNALTLRVPRGAKRAGGLETVHCRRFLYVLPIRTFHRRLICWLRAFKYLLRYEPDYTVQTVLDDIVGSLPTPSTRSLHSWLYSSATPRTRRA